MVSNDYKEKASRAYLEHIKAKSIMLGMLETEIHLASRRGLLDDAGILVERRDRYVDEVHEAKCLLRRLDRMESRILVGQYLEGKSQESIADEVGYAVRTVQRINQTARQDLYDWLPDDYK